MKYEILKNAAGYKGTTAAFKNNHRNTSYARNYSNLVKDIGLSEAFKKELEEHDKNYDEDRFRVVCFLTGRPNLIESINSSNSPLLFEEYKNNVEILESSDLVLDEGVIDSIRKVIEWIGKSFSRFFLSGKKRRAVVEKVAEDLKENPNDLPQKMSVALKNNGHSNVSQSDITRGIEAGKAQASGNNSIAMSAVINHSASNRTVSENLTDLENFIQDGGLNESQQTDPYSILVESVQNFIKGIPFIGPFIFGAFSYLLPMLTSMMVSQLLYKAINKTQSKDVQNKDEITKRK